MTASRIALVAAVTSAVMWALKGVAIGVAGGLDRSPWEGPLFILGLLAHVIALGALGAAITSGRSLPLRALAAAAGVAAGYVLSMLAAALAAGIMPASTGWVRSEAGLWLAALLAVAVTAVWYARRPRTPVPA
jgi:hypothetical protein